jgi:single-strand selective monofunctional uracil DNA glycosylase
MNPGPYGMAQTGIPFGEVAAVRDWLGIKASVGKPPNEHPKRLIAGFGCPRSEPSGARLWGMFAARFGTPGVFFRDHFVANYCPLVFMLESGGNFTPDKLPGQQREDLFSACDAHLRTLIGEVKPRWVVGVGNFAFERAQAALAGSETGIAKILHPSPASPAANRDWAGTAIGQLRQAGIWE